MRLSSTLRAALIALTALVGAGAAVVRGAQAVVLTNQKGAVLTLTGEQAGLIVSADLSGLAITLK